METVAIIIIIIFLALLIIQWNLLVKTAHRKKKFSRAFSKERDATTEILNLLKKVIHTGDSDLLLKETARLILTAMNAEGAATFKYSGDSFHGCGVAGAFPLPEIFSSLNESELLSDSEKYNQIFSQAAINVNDIDFAQICEKGYCSFRGEYPEWLQEFFSDSAWVILAAPIVLNSDISGCIIVTFNNKFDGPCLCKEDGCYLGRLGELTALSMEMVEVVKERKNYEGKLRTAQQEGMLAISSGIIHNIGNAVTVAKLSVNDLKSKFDAPENSPETLILEEILPGIEKHAEKGSLQQFISEDKVGKQYPAILRELTEHISKKLRESEKLVKSLETKLEHMSGIIELQQAFVGELGTENMTNMAKILDSAIAIFNETCDKKGMNIERKIDGNTPDILLDSSMMTQVFINLIKNAIESIETGNEDKKYEINVELYQKDIEGQNYVIGEVKDNGPGIKKELIDKVFNFGFSTKTGKKTHGIGLHASQQMVKKYDGRIEVSSTPDQGTCFRVLIPVK